MKEINKLRSKGYTVSRELNRLYYRRFYRRDYNPDGVDIFDEDWDNLIILDACRYDIFEEEADLPGTVDRRQSRGATTKEFVRANFSNKQLHDVVYVTGNSWYLRLREALNSEVHAVYNPTGRDPTVVTEKVREIVDEHPHKRLLIHYIPPHHPFDGPTAEKHLPSYDDQLDGLYSRIRQGTLSVDRETLQQAYRENLHRVLPEVKSLFDLLSGKTVVTADHGELLGDQCRPIPTREYGHHLGLYVDELVEIPWLTYESGTRRTVRSDVPDSDESVSASDETIDERLRNLGYKL